MQLPTTHAFRVISGLTLSLAAVFLFFRLGHYAFWDDEALVGLAAQGVLKTGDTSVVLDRNIVAYEDGLLLKNYCDRSTPPLPAYLTAVSFALLGKSTLAARLPFALCGLLSVSLMLYWARKLSLTVWGYGLLGIAILGNVSLFLFCRQCRYYAPAILASIAIAYCYSNWEGKRWRLAVLVLCSLVLLACNYMEFIALYVCLAVDYCVWGRKQRHLGFSDWVWLLVPQIFVGGIVVSIWNPAATANKGNFLASSLMDRFAYIAWFLRDLNLCEFGNGLLLAAAPLLWLRRRNLWLIRIPILLACYLAATALLCPFKGAVFSEVRYLCPTIPLWIALGVVVILELTRGTKTLILPAGILLFWTNLLSANWLIPFPYPAAGWLTPYPYAITSPRSTSYLYGRELWMPPADPYRLAANWIGANMSPGQTIWVAPGYAVYPLMFDAPQVVYGWQLSFPPKEPYRNLPEIYFLGRQAPDVMIGFAGWVENVRNLRKQMEAAGIHYRELPALDCFGRDAFRPELFRRTFRSISGFNPETEGVHIFQRSEIDNAGQGLPAR